MSMMIIREDTYSLHLVQITISYFEIMLYVKSDLKQDPQAIQSLTA